jgi:hypothetical protein
VKHLRAFGSFWWNFIVGDDWRLALGVAVTLGLTWLLADQGANPWWLVPVAVVLLLAWSVWRTARQEPS